MLLKMQKKNTVMLLKIRTFITSAIVVNLVGFLWRYLLQWGFIVAKERTSHICDGRGRVSEVNSKRFSGSRQYKARPFLLS